jgi:hypothetical protein
MRYNLAAVGLVGLALAAAGPAADAAELILNGGFEGGLAGWTVTDQAGGSGSWFLQTGASSPLNGFAVAPPPEGVNAAMTDQTGPGSHALTQGFVVPAGVTSATLSFQLYINNQAGAFFTPASLDALGGFANQQFRADIVSATAGVFSVAPADVLASLYQTMVGDPTLSGYALVSVDVTAVLAANAGQTLVLRFAEVDNQLFFAAGVDGVSLSVETRVPEPTTLAMLGLGLLGLAAARRRSA